MPIDFTNIQYLKAGNATQQSAFRILTGHGIMQKLSAYSPILAGTIPININIEGSDLDIICHCPDKDIFSTDITMLFSGFEKFSLRENKQWDAVVATFYIDGFQVEIFGQDKPTSEQNAYRHMVAEHKLLQRHGDALRQQVIALKQQGLKTEPAFALALSLEGNPYEALLSINI